MGKTLTQQQIESIPELYVSGMTTWEVAAALGISQTTVRVRVKAARLTRTGAARRKKQTHEAFEKHFWERVERGDECWFWHGAHNKNGYAVVGRGGKVLWAHRVAWEIAFGMVPAGMVLDHLCRTPKCVNPNHLQPVPQVENIRRGDVAKVSAEQVADMRSRYMNGERSWTKFAAEFGLTKRHVGYILKGQAWKDLPGAVKTQGRWA